MFVNSAKIDPTLKSSDTFFFASIDPLLSTSSLPAVSNVLSETDTPNAKPAALAIAGLNIKNNVENNSITYWLNLLQNLKCEENIFLTLNPYFKIDKSKILKKVRFTHPYFDQSALDHQGQLKNLQNKRNILFCGSYFGYGFHEDGIKSSLEMIKYIDV